MQTVELTNDHVVSCYRHGASACLGSSPERTDEQPGIDNVVPGRPVQRRVSASRRHGTQFHPVARRSKTLNLFIDLNGARPAAN